MPDIFPAPHENERNTNGNNTFPPGTPFSRNSHLGPYRRRIRIWDGATCAKSLPQASYCAMELYTDGPPEQLCGTGIMPPHVAEETVEPVGLTS